MTDWDYAVSNCVRVVDGDTFDLTLTREMDFGFRLIERKFWTARFRLLNLDAPEARSAEGPAATDFAAQWIADALVDYALRGTTVKTDHFGRWLIDLYRADTKEHLADAMKAAGHLKPTMGVVGP